MTNLIPAKVTGGRSFNPSFMKSQVDPQMPQRMSQTNRAFIVQKDKYQKRQVETRGLCLPPLKRADAVENQTTVADYQV